MWKFMLFGIVVQVVLLVAMLDVYVYQKEGRLYFLGWYFESKRTPSTLTIFLVDGLDFSDLQGIDMLDDWRKFELLDSLDNASAISSNNDESSLEDLHEHENSTVFDKKRVFYVGESSIVKYFNASDWRLVNITCSTNTTEQDQNQTYNDRVIESYREFLNSSDFLQFPLRMLRFDVRIRDPNATEKTRRQSGQRILKSILDLVAITAANDSSEDSSSVFAITSSVRVLSHRFPLSKRADDILAVWASDGHIDPNCNNETITYNEVYRILRILSIAGTACRYTAQGIMTNHQERIGIEGNLLGFFGLDTAEVRHSLPGYPITYVQFRGLPVLNTVFSLLDNSWTQTDPVVITISVLLFSFWVCLLVVKAVNLANDVEEYGKLPNITLTRLCDTVFLLLLVFFFVMFAFWSFNIRHFVYTFIMILTARWFFDAVLLLVRNSSSIVMPGSAKMLLLAAIAFGVVEMLFWTARYGHMYIVFTILVATRILMEAFSTANLCTEITLAISACSVGLALLIRALQFDPVITVNVGALFWIVGSILAIKFLMKELNYERFVTVVCLSQFIFSALMANLIMLTLEEGSSESTIVAVLCSLLVLSLALPTLGNPLHRLCRLLQLSVVTASFFLFFSQNCEILVLFAVTCTAMCIYKLENASMSPNNEELILRPFSILLYAVTLATASYAISPVGGPYLFQSDALVEMGVACNIMPVIVVYLIKLGFLVNFLQSGLLSCVKKSLETSTLLLIVVVFNLVSLRTLFHLILFPWATELKSIYIIHIFMHFLAALMFYLYPFGQILREGSMLVFCRSQGVAPIDRKD